jgi:hypothetical protein
MTETLKEFAASIGLIRSAALGTAVLISVGFGATTGAVGATEVTTNQADKDRRDRICGGIIPWDVGW